jgi:hypothetical protein
MDQRETMCLMCGPDHDDYTQDPEHDRVIVDEEDFICIAPDIPPYQEIPVTD